MSLDIQLYLSQYSGQDLEDVYTGAVGGPITELVAEDLFIEYSDDLVAPAHGEGVLYSYSKYFVNITGFDGATHVNHVKACVLYSNHPEQIYIAATPHHEDALTGGPNIFGDQSEHRFADLGFSGGAPTVFHDRPEFSPANGLSNAVTLYNISGELGGDVTVGPGTGEALAFWVLRRIDEHTLSGQNNFRLGFFAENSVR